MMRWHDMDGWDWVWATTMMVLFWGVVATIVLVALRRSPDETRHANDTPEDVLRRRLASGEINVSEYHERLDALHK